MEKKVKGFTGTFSGTIEWLEEKYNTYDVINHQIVKTKTNNDEYYRVVIVYKNQ